MNKILKEFWPHTLSGYFNRFFPVVRIIEKSCEQNNKKNFGRILCQVSSIASFQLSELLKSLVNKILKEFWPHTLSGYFNRFFPVVRIIEKSCEQNTKKNFGRILCQVSSIASFQLSELLKSLVNKILKEFWSHTLSGYFNQARSCNSLAKSCIPSEESPEHLQSYYKIIAGIKL